MKRWHWLVLIGVLLVLVFVVGMNTGFIYGEQIGDDEAAAGES